MEGTGLGLKQVAPDIHFTVDYELAVIDQKHVNGFDERAVALEIGFNGERRAGFIDKAPSIFEAGASDLNLVSFNCAAPTIVPAKGRWFRQLLGSAEPS